MVYLNLLFQLYQQLLYHHEFVLSKIQTQTKQRDDLLISLQFQIKGDTLFRYQEGIYLQAYLQFDWTKHQHLQLFYQI